MFKDMFKGMQDLLKETKNKASLKKNLENTAKHQDIAPILSADILLGTEKRQQNISEIRGLLNLPDDEFDRVFKTVTENFAEFAQNLPETERSYYAGMGGMLDHALERASLSLFLCRTYLLPQDVTLASVSEAEMIWVYAVYTAALLYDIGKIATTHNIVLTDQHGNTLKSWLPYAGPMTSEDASHYALAFSEEHYDHIRWMVTPLLARQILPEDGFNWIASDNDVLESWLGLLSDENRQISSILTVIKLADAQLLETFFTDKKIFRNNLSPQVLALLAKFKKERQEALARQKELSEKELLEQGDKSREKDKNTEKNKVSQTVDDGKAAKQSIFGLPSHLTEKAVKTAKISTAYILPHTDKEIAGKFIQWLKQNEAGNKANGYIHAVEKGALIDQKALQQFLSDTKMTSVGIDKLKQVLSEAQMASPVNYTETLQLAQKHGILTPGLLMTNPYAAFPSGTPPPLAIFTPVVQNQHTPPVENMRQSSPETSPVPPVPRPIPPR